VEVGEDSSSNTLVILWEARAVNRTGTQGGDYGFATAPEQRRGRCAGSRIGDGGEAR
jgi:hypothetical protein